MKPRLAFFLQSTFFLLLTSLAFAAPVSTDKSPEAIKPAADFALKSIAGNNVRLSELRGQVVLVNFWASWCGPCRQEMPLLDALYQRYKSLGFTLLGVNVEEDSSNATRYLKDTPVTFPVLLDTKNSVSKSYELDAMPSTVIIDRDGNIRHIHRGYLPGYENDYQNQVRALLRE